MFTNFIESWGQGRDPKVYYDEGTGVDSREAECQRSFASCFIHPYPGGDMVFESQSRRKVHFSRRVLYIGTLCFLVRTLAPAEAPRTRDEEVPSPCATLYFAPGSCALSFDSQQKLDHVTALLGNTRPPVDVLVYGHTDSSGSERENIQLSDQRAKETVRYLVSHLDVDSRVNFHPVACGMNSPAATNSTEFGRSQNRRVEVLIASSLRRP